MKITKKQLELITSRSRFNRVSKETLAAAKEVILTGCSYAEAERKHGATKNTCTKQVQIIFNEYESAMEVARNG